MMRTGFVILLLAHCLHSASAQDFTWPHGLRGTSGGGGTSGLDEYSYKTDGTFPAETFNPDAALQKRLIVEWGKASMGYVDRDPDEDDLIARQDQYRSTWKDDPSPRYDRRLAIRGRLLIESEDGKNRTPIDWLQGVRVIVSRRPDQRHDWSVRQEMHDAVWGDFVIWKKGEFLAIVSPGEVRRSVGREIQFQVALSLGEKDGQKITWKNTTGVLPQSVAMLKIPGPAPISPTMQFINGAPSYDQNDFNPAKLVRAVNHLMPMGKEKAIHELRTFLEIALDSSETMRVDENIDTSDRTCVFLIVRLLFESADPNEELPAILTVPFVPVPDEKDKPLWPLHPVALQNDVPFFLVYGGGLGGVPQDPEEHVDWAEEHGTIRTKPLRPLDNPMLAAERLAVLPQTRRLYHTEFQNTDYKDLLYRQAWNSVEDAAPDAPQPKPVPPANDVEEIDWDARAKAAARLKIRWSEKENRYVVP